MHTKKLFKINHISRFSCFFFRQTSPFLLHDGDFEKELSHLLKNERTSSKTDNQDKIITPKATSTVNFLKEEDFQEKHEENHAQELKNIDSSNKISSTLKVTNHHLNVTRPKSKTKKRNERIKFNLFPKNSSEKKFNKVLFNSAANVNSNSTHESSLEQKEKDDLPNYLEPLSLKEDFLKFQKKVSFVLTPYGRQLLKRIFEMDEQNKLNEAKHEQIIQTVLDKIYLHFTFFLNVKMEELSYDFGKILMFPREGPKIIMTQNLIDYLRKSVSLYLEGVANLELNVENIVDLVLIVKNLGLGKELFFSFINNKGFRNEAKEGKLNSGQVLQFFNFCVSNKMVFYHVQGKHKLRIFQLLDLVMNQMNLNEIILFLQTGGRLGNEMKSILTEPQKEFAALIKKLETRILEKLNSNIDDLSMNERELLESVDFYIEILKFFSKLNIYSPKLVKLIEKNLIQLVPSTSAVKNLISFILLSDMFGGSEIYKVLRTRGEEIRNSCQKDKSILPIMVHFIYKSIMMHVGELWSSINFQTYSDQDATFSYFTKMEFEQSKKNLIEKFKSESLFFFEKLLDLIEIEKLDKENEYNLFRTLFFVNKMEPLNHLGNKQEFKNFLKRNDFFDPQELSIKRSQKFVNQFDSDIKSFLIKNKIKFNEQHFDLFRYSDFYLPKENLIFELDGKYHFHTNNEEKEKFSNIVRNFLILLNGNKLMEIDYKDWDNARYLQVMDVYLMKRIDFFKKNKDVLFIK